MDLLYLRNKKCAAVGCTSVSAEYKFFVFPRKPERYRQWAAVAQNPSLNGKTAFLCSRHFDSKQFRDPYRTLLIMGATPSISMPPPSLPMSPEPTSSPSSPLEAIPVEVSGSNISFEPDMSSEMTSTPLTKRPCSIKLSYPDQHDVAEASTSHNSVQGDASTSADMGEASTFLGAEEMLPYAEGVINLEDRVDLAQNRTTSTKKRKSILAEISCTRKKQLTPRKKVLLHFYEKNLRSLRTIRKKYRDAKATISRLTDVTLDPAKAVEALSQSMSTATAQFVASQIRCGKRRPKGRRWTDQDKLLALAIYKRSPKAYTLLQGIFALPSRRTLIKIVNCVPFDVGIDERVFASLRHSMRDMGQRDRVCSLMFDEMSLREHLQYDVRADRITGFQDLGGSARSGLVANQALVVMLQGLHRKWKQPVAYYLTRGGIRSEDMVEILRKVLTACDNSGLHVVSIICDMGTKNVRALKLMGSSNSEPFILHNNRCIYTLFDPPHLIKCLRNMLFRHNVTVPVKIGEELVKGKAKWEYILQAYHMDRMQPHYHHLHKLSSDHLKPVGYLSMRVSIASQVLSNAMAATISGLVSFGKLPAAALHTAHYVGLADKLFDSFNGRLAMPEGALGLRCQLRQERETLHLKFWKEALANIHSWQFERTSATHPGEPKVFQPPCQGGWMKTLRAVPKLWSHLKELGFSFLETRALNQDPLEHLFGCIRQQCGSNTNPTVPQFQSALKACIINGLAFKDLIGSNCEEELDPATLLSNLHEFLKDPAPTTSDTGIHNPLEEDNTVLTRDFDPESDVFSLSYVTGFIAKRCLKGSSCVSCTDALITSHPDEFQHAGIIFKEYSENRSGLTYPTPRIVDTVGRATTVFDEIMERDPHSENLRVRLVTAMLEKVDLTWLETACGEHFASNSAKIFTAVCLISLPWWCKKRNRATSDKNKDMAAARKLKILRHT